MTSANIDASPVVLGLDFGGTKIAASVCDASGARLASAVVESLPEMGAEAAMRRGLDAARGILAGLGPESRLAAVGAATFGIPQEDGVLLAPSIPGWEAIPFGRTLREAFPGVPVCVATDVKAAAAAELRWGALAGRDPALYLNIGTGLSVAIVAGGTVITGANQAAGEIGYMVRSVEDVYKPPSERVHLEQVISGRALADRATRRIGRTLTAAGLFELAITDDIAAELVADFVRELAMYVVNLAVATDPSAIVVGGGMVGSWDQIAPGIRRALDAAVPFPPELLVATSPYDAPLIGALALGVEACTQSDGAYAHQGGGSSSW